MKIKYIGARNVYVELGDYVGAVKSGDIIEIADGTAFDVKKFKLVDAPGPVKKQNKKTGCCTVE
jgi:hypothetical protein